MIIHNRPRQSGKTESLLYALSLNPRAVMLVYSESIRKDILRIIHNDSSNNSYYKNIRDDQIQSFSNRLFGLKFDIVYIDELELCLEAYTGKHIDICTSTEIEYYNQN